MGLGGWGGVRLLIGNVAMPGVGVMVGSLGCRGIGEINCLRRNWGRRWRLNIGEPLTRYAAMNPI